MRRNVALCLEEKACCNPELVGLAGERLDVQAWCKVFTSGNSARKGIKADAAIEEAWVVSCDDVDPINLAASLKLDRPELRVRLVTAEGCGSLYSRAHTAGIDEVILQSAFLKLYATRKAQLHHAQGRMAAQSAQTTQPTPGAQAAHVAQASQQAPATHAAQASQQMSAGYMAAAAQMMPAAQMTSATQPTAQMASAGQVPAQMPATAQSATQMRQTAQPTAQMASAAQQANQMMPAAQQANQMMSAQPAMQLTNRMPAQARQVQGQPASAPAQKARKGLIIPIVSGSGGAGKSSVSVAAAYCAASRGFRVLLIDCDLQFGDVANMVGVKGALTLDAALAFPERLENEISGEGNLAVLAAPARLEDSEVVARKLPGLLSALTGRFDVIVANTGAAWADYHAILLERSSVALFLMDQRMSSVRACKHALELCARCGIASGPFRFALNRCAKGAPLTSLDVSSVLDNAPVFELRDGGRDVEDCLSAGAMEELFEARNDFIVSVDHVIGQLLPAAPRAPESQGASSDGSFFTTRKRGRSSGKRRQRKS